MTFHPLGAMYDDGLDPDAPFDDDVWELYHVAEDLSETNDLAAQEPERLAEMIDLWWEEARRNDVLPLDNRPLERDPEPAAAPARGARHATCTSRTARRCPSSRRCTCRNRAHTITAEVEIGRDGVVAEGVLLAMGSALGGFSLYLLDGRLRYVHNLYALRARTSIDSDDVIAPGRARRSRTSSRRRRASRAPGELRVDGARRRRGRDPALHADVVLEHRRRPHVRLRGRARGRRRLHRAVPLQRRDPPRRRRRRRASTTAIPMAVFQAIMSEQ